MARTLCVIPARLNSTRLERKMLQKIGNKELILHTYEAAQKSKKADKIVIATDDVEIENLAKANGADVVLSPKELTTGSDRVAYASASLDFDIVVNLQGDEPFIDPRAIDHAVQALEEDSSFEMSTCASPLNWQEDYTSSALVKVACDRFNRALYFSRSPIPFLRDESIEKKDIPVYRHMGLYAYKNEFLQRFTKMPRTPLEISESLEQLRAMENKVEIYVAVGDYRSIEVNTIDELEAARRYWQTLQTK